MKRLSIFFFLLLITLTSQAQANYLLVEDAWIRAAPPNARVMVAYAKITNTSEYDIWITGADSDKFSSAELHETIEADGMTSMIHLNFIKLSPGQTVDFKPGGKHFMLFNPQEAIMAGQQIHFLLILGNGDKEAFFAKVLKK